MNIQKNLKLLEELEAFLNCGYQPGEILDLLTSELGRKYRQRLQRGEAWSAVWELEPEMNLLLRTAELNGRLKNFIALALEHYREQISFQNALKQKAAYPALTLVFTILMLLGFVLFLLPLFNSLAVELGGGRNSAFIQWSMLGGIFIFLVNIRYFYRLLMNKTGLQKILETVQLLNLLTMIEQAGIPLANFLADYLPRNPRRDLDRVYFYLTKGLSVGDSLAKAELFGREELKLLTLGGGVNYARGLNYLLKYFKQEYQNKINKITFYLEPGLLLFSGGVMAVTAWSFFKPLFSYSGIDF